MWSESITVYAGMTTGKWNADAGEVDESGARKVSKVRIYSTFYVVGDEPCSEWFKDNRPHADEIKNGSLSYPYENIQDAIDRVIAINNESTSFTICVDGALTCDSAVTQADGESENANINGMADFSVLDKTLSLTIKGISETEKATLNANKATRVIYAAPGTQGNLNLTLENLVITGGDTANTTSKYGAGIYAKGGAYTIRNCAISGNKTTDNGGGGYVGTGGSLEIIDCTVSGNTAKIGGGVYVSSGGEFIMNGGTIGGDTEGDGNKASSDNGGGVYVSGGKFTMNGGKISKHAVNAVWVYSNGEFTMTGGEISSNTASSFGAGVVIYRATFIMKGGAISGNKINVGIAMNVGGGVYVDDGGEFMMEGGTISGNKVKGTSSFSFGGGGVHLREGGVLNMSGGTISGNESSKYGGGVYVFNGTFSMNGGEISGNTAGKGAGAYLYVGSSLSGAAHFADGDDIYLASPNIALTISGELTQEKVATITPSEYASDTVILRADGTNITEIDPDICNKFSITPDSDNTVLWNIFLSDDKKSGVLKKGEISSEIQVSVNALEAYTFTTMVNGNAALVEGMALASGNTVKLVKVVDSTGSAQSGQCTLRIQDKSGNPFPSAETTGVPPFSITVPAVPCEQTAQVYVELKFDDRTVINKAVNVTISG